MTAHETPVSITDKPSSALRPSLLAGLIGGLMGAIMSGGINYLVGDVPDTLGSYVFNSAMAGLFSGFTAGFFGLLVHLRQTSSRSRAGRRGR